MLYVPVFDLCLKHMCTSSCTRPVAHHSWIYNARPGIDESKFQVGFHVTEISRIHKIERRTRVHHLRDDSAQNENERMNVCIDDAVVNYRAVKWQYFKPLHGKSKEEVEAMTMEEIMKEENDCMEWTVWRCGLACTYISRTSRRSDAMTDNRWPFNPFIQQYRISPNVLQSRIREN